MQPSIDDEAAVSVGVFAGRIATLLWGAFAMGCDGSSGTSAANDQDLPPAPSVIAVSPDVDATDVPVGSSITATYNVPVVFPGTATFAVTCASPCVSPTGTPVVDVSGRIVGFARAQGTTLEYSTLYTATVEGAETVGTSQIQTIPFSWSFVTEAAPTAVSKAVNARTASGTLSASRSRAAGDRAPVSGASGVMRVSSLSVLYTEPADGAFDVCPHASISAIFDIPSGRFMDHDTLTALTFTVTESAPPGLPVLAASVTLDAETGAVATFTLDESLTPGVTYTAMIAGGVDGVRSLATTRNGMDGDYLWTFTVGPAEHCPASVR